MRKKVAIIGHFGGKENFLDGQTVKTKVLFEQLEKTGKYDLYKVDTYYKTHNPVKLLWQTLYCLIFYKDVFVLLSRGGMRIYFPMLYYATKIFHTRVYHDVIGGNLDTYVSTNPNYQKYLNSFKVNWVETQSLMTKLKRQQISNVEVLPNFKDLNSIPSSDYGDEIYRFCTFSRVMKEKGIVTAVEVIKRINDEYGKIVCTLDIYGAIDEGYADSFSKLSEAFDKNVTYGGMIQFADSVAVLKNYFALLFPTFWDGEGFPGTILDAYASAIPVIASDWNYNRELVSHLKTGLVYPEDKMTDLYDAVKWAIEHRVEMNAMRKYCEDEYKKYLPDTVVKTIIEKLQ